MRSNVAACPRGGFFRATFGVCYFLMLRFFRPPATQRPSIGDPRYTSSTALTANMMTLISFAAFCGVPTLLGRMKTMYPTKI